LRFDGNGRLGVEDGGGHVSLLEVTVLAAMTICRVKRKRMWILNSLPRETGNQTPSL
jgi:hypothetical protein